MKFENLRIIQDVTGIAPSSYVTLAGLHYDLSSVFARAAREWFEFGLQVIPVTPGTKVSAVKWDGWLDGLSAEKIKRHWTAHPDHEVGFIVGDEVIVFDADSPESLAALNSIQTAHGVYSKTIVRTNKGVHRYFRLAPGTSAKSDSHSTEVHPSRIDVKTGRGLVILPPSTDKSIVANLASDVHDLVEAPQEFIDAIFSHNGRPAPSQDISSKPATTGTKVNSEGMAQVKALLNQIDPDVGYQDWFNCAAAIHHESGGSDDGLELFNEWSSKGHKYPGRKAIEAKWKSLKSDQLNPITIATLKKMVATNGGDWMELCAGTEPAFTVWEGESISEPVQPNAGLTTTGNLLDRFSLRGMSAEIEKRAVAEVPLLGQVALLGQFTVLYGAPNTGKTLITLGLITEAIQQGRVDPSRVYYLNMDDNSAGLVAKLQIAEEYGFHMIAEAHRDFSADQVVGLIEELSQDKNAGPLVIIIDTLKKVTDLMDKTKASRFTKAIRGFVLLGGTVVALAHTNKNPGRDGKPVYGGVSDIVNDCDCAYTIRTLDTESDATQKVIEFENIKRRGGVVQQAAYSYTTEDGIAYNELILSVKSLDEKTLAPLKQAKAIRSDADVIETVRTCIAEGFNTKMKLATEAASRAGISRKSALRIIEQYTGENPSVHRWTFSVQDRGAKVYVLLEPPQTM